MPSAPWRSQRRRSESRPTLAVSATRWPSRVSAGRAASASRCSTATRVALLRALVLRDAASLVGRRGRPCRCRRRRSRARPGAPPRGCPRRRSPRGSRARARRSRRARWGRRAPSRTPPTFSVSSVREVRGQQVRGHHDRAVGERRVVVAHAEQLRHHAAGRRPRRRRRARGSTGPRCASNMRAVGVGDHARSACEARCRSRRTSSSSRRDEALVLEDLDVRVEDRREVGAEALADVVAHVVELAQRALERAARDRAAPASAVGVRRVLDALEVERGRSRK